MPCFIKKVLINRRMPTTFRMWLLIDLAEKKAMVKDLKEHKPLIAAHWMQKAEFWKRLAGPRPEWWIHYF